MNGVGAPEVLVILIVALLVFGPKSIPDIARTVAKGVRELRRLSTEFQREIHLAEAHEEEARRAASRRVSAAERPAPPGGVPRTLPPPAGAEAGSGNASGADAPSGQDAGDP